mmetsp:Transcript_6989/g.14324  ORF Transcript_6989/g.14324 Transcript_6989/m.14324 type:complete len:308 (+) Transcript_6989:704-1627(+)
MTSARRQLVQQSSHQVQTVTRHAGNFHHGREGRQLWVRNDDAINIGRPSNGKPLFSQRRPNRFRHGPARVLDHVPTGHRIHLGQNDNGGDTAHLDELQVMMGHVRHALRGIDQDEGVIGHAPRQTVNGRFEVLFVTRQIHERHGPMSLRGQVTLCVVVLTRDFVALWQDNRFTLVVECHEMLRNGAGPTRRAFVRIFQDALSTGTIAIIQRILRQGSNEGRFSRIDIAQNGHANLTLRHDVENVVLLVVAHGGGGGGGGFVRRCCGYVIVVVIVTVVRCLVVVVVVVVVVIRSFVVMMVSKVVCSFV